MDPAVEARIRARAYEIWQEEGRPTGRDVEHWIRAVLELARDGSIRLMPDGVLQTDRATRDDAGRGGS
ncbi:MAG: hypothetical protein JWM18_3697 [Chloroflexi bacterium]|jgi:hypothetical protein|nr:hypothetical protein [Chloroflexota bacterium]